MPNRERLQQGFAGGGMGLGVSSQGSATHVRFGSKADISVECAPSGGHLAGLELTRTAGLSEDESHGQAPFP